MSESIQNIPKPIGPFGWTMGILGTLFSASSIISLIQHWSDIELATIPALYVTYYRELTRNLVDWIPFPYDWRIPQGYLDALTINCVIAAAAVRATISVRYHQTRLFITLVGVSAFLLLAWAAAPLLVGFVINFSRSTVSEALKRLSEWEPELEKLRESHPGRDFVHIEDQIKGDHTIIMQYTDFLIVGRRFGFGLILTLLATCAFFLLNGISPQPHSRNVRPNQTMQLTASARHAACTRWGHV